MSLSDYAEMGAPVSRSETMKKYAACVRVLVVGLAVLQGIGFDFMSPEFLSQYKAAIDEGGKLGMKM